VTAAVMLIGSPGAGKSSVLSELSTLLETNRTAHGVIESEALAQGWPMPTDHEWLSQLEAVVALQRQAGRDLLLVVATPESSAELAGLRRAVSSDVVKVVCLIAPANVAANRISEREPDSWAGKAWLVGQARRLAETIPLFDGIDVHVTTEGRAASAVAAELYASLPEVFVLQ
jgi:ribose 1,5-bisphosphokinase PhnN